MFTYNKVSKVIVQLCMRTLDILVDYIYLYFLAHVYPTIHHKLHNIFTQ